MWIRVEPLPGLLPPRISPPATAPDTEPGAQPPLPSAPPPPDPRPTAALPGASGPPGALGHHAHRVAQAICEVVSGRRPIGQLSQWATHQVLARVLSWSRHRDRIRTSVQVASIQIQHPRRGVAEVAARLEVPIGPGPTRSVALALRLERSGQRWVCTAVDAGPRGLVLEHRPAAVRRLLA